MSSDTEFSASLQPAVWRAMNALRAQGSLPEDNAILITSLMVHRMKHAGSDAEVPTATVWARLRTTDPRAAIKQILDEVEQDLSARIERPYLDEQAAREILDAIDGAYRQGAVPRNTAISVEEVEALGGTTETVSTPAAIATLMVEILNPKAGSSIYDPAMGSGGLLLASLSFVRNQVQAGGLLASGTEKIARLVTLAKMNFALHGFSGEHLLSKDAFTDAGFDAALEKHDYVISNPPVSQHESDETLHRLSSHPAFRFGPPLSSVDLNFVQLAVGSLKPGGSAVLLVRLRPLLGTGREQEVRKRLVRAGCVQAVITLAERLLPTTPAACAVLVLRGPLPGHYESKELNTPVRLIDASSEFEPDERGKRTLNRSHMDKILEALDSPDAMPGFSVFLSADELADHDYNLVARHHLRPDDARINLGDNTVMRPIGEVAEVLSGPSLGKQLPDGETPVIQGKDLPNRVIYLEELDRRDLSSIARELVRTAAGDILIQRIGETPAAHYIDQSLAGIPVSDTAYVVRLREPNDIAARFIVAFLNSPTGRDRLRAKHMGAVVPTLSKTALRTVAVPFTDVAVTKLALELDDLQRALHKRVRNVSELESRLFGVSHPDEFVAAFKDLRRCHQSLELLQLDSEGIAALNATVSLAALEDAVSFWERNQDCNREEFWHQALDQRSFLFAQLFHFPIVIIRDRAYVGGKRLDNTHGSIADFLAKTKITGEALIIEIKTPRTDLLAHSYRSDVYPWSFDLSGALSQVLQYRSALSRNLLPLREDVDRELESDQPRCVVIAGNVSRELDSRAKRRSFERIRQNLHGVSVIGFDELFGRAAGLLDILKKPN